ncbi:UDP-glycosyltransferase UGT4-like [Adelges cooleyi]|uniref:UDP-glycosyltransferase UGT4-like n=1 Tax=Adelges cooleyi TaxID=133065 RepID=UPI00217F2864|nr:UDP-glycosyltransferase UGT4-like [Adelges cooleyi]
MSFSWILLTFPIIANAANILVFTPLPVKSHIRGFQPLFEQLAQRGHNVTVLSCFPVNGTIPNYTDVGPFMEGERKRNVMELVDMNFLNSSPLKWNLGVKLGSLVLSHKKMMEFIHSESYSFDLVMVETFVQEYTVAIGHKFNAPVINLVPAALWPSISKWLHMPSTFSYIPDICSSVTDEMTFIERLKNTISGVIQLYVENLHYMPKIKQIMDKYFKYTGWETRPSLEEMLKNVSLTLVNGHYAVGVTRPYLPGVIEVGGMHIRPSKRLPQNIQSFMDSAPEGVILFSFGSVVNLSDLPKVKLDAIITVLAKLKQKIIIKWSPDENIKLPSNIITEAWIPQQDILAHSNLKLFITHGGLHSLEEATYYAVPVVGVPFFADQYSNVKLVENKFCGKLEGFHYLTEETFGNAVNEVLTNSMYKENMKKQSLIYKDQPTSPMERAVYWVEYVIRNRGAEHLKSDSLDLNDSQYFLIDVVLAVLVSTGVLFCVCYYGSKKLLCPLFWR